MPHSMSVFVSQETIRVKKRKITDEIGKALKWKMRVEKRFSI
jgi:hypothetical protein